MREDYRKHVAPALANLRRAGTDLDLVYVSHIDRDHISGVLQLMDDLVAWRVYDYQRGAGNRDYPEPSSARPPEIRDLWHNAFHELVSANERDIEKTLAARASLFATSDDQAVCLIGIEQRELATSIAEGIELSRRASPDQLGIAVNRQFDRKLALVRNGARPIQLGTLAITLIGPFPRDLRKLRDEWNVWLRESKEQHEQLRERMQRDADRLATTDFDRLRRAITLVSGELGDRKKVTTPNLASLMLLVEEDDRTVLLTGDGHWEEILAGLEKARRLDAEGRLHVDVLKVQHHGSENNLTPAFAKQITADRYLFCANGEHGNPDCRIVQAIIDSRLGPKSLRSTHSSADRRFKLQFNSSPEATEGDEREHMRDVEKLAMKAADASSRRMTCTFLKHSSYEISLN
jgi:hypothetical protein